MEAAIAQTAAQPQRVSITPPTSHSKAAGREPRRRSGAARRPGPPEHLSRCTESARLGAPKRRAQHQSNRAFPPAILVRHIVLRHHEPAHHRGGEPGGSKGFATPTAGRAGTAGRPGGGGGTPAPPRTLSSLVLAAFFCPPAAFWALPVRFGRFAFRNWPSFSESFATGCSNRRCLPLEVGRMQCHARTISVSLIDQTIAVRNRSIAAPSHAHKTRRLADRAVSAEDRLLRSGTDTASVPLQR